MKHGPVRDPKTGRVSGGNPGNKGGGRPSNAFLERCAHLSDTVVLQKVTDYLTDEAKTPNDAAWRWCAEMVIERSKGRVSTVMEVTGLDGGPVQFSDSQAIEELRQEINRISKAKR